MPLLERDDLLQRLRHLEAAARGGNGALVAISGEAGVGKTALLREAFAPIRAHWGFCEPLTTPRPLGPFSDITAGWQDEGRGGGEGLDDLDVGSMREQLLAWLRTSPDPLVIEDGHWIDAASAEVLRFLARRIEQLPGLIVLTFRDEVPADHPLRRLLGELSSAPALVRLEVPPLSPTAVAELLADTGIDPQAAYDMTGGNAFLVTQVRLSAEAPSTVTLRDAVAARLGALSPESRAAVQLLSVMPGNVPVALLGDQLRLLDEAVVAGLVTVEGTRAGFRHELVRLSVERELPPGLRRALHTEVLQLLRAGGHPEPALLAFHAREAHEPELAFTSDRAAAERAVALGAHREAAAHYRRALSDLHAGTGAERSDLWLALSREEYLIGRDTAAESAARNAVDLRPEGTDPIHRSVALRWYSRVIPDERQSNDLARAAIAALEPLGPSQELAAAYAHLATLRMLARDLIEAQQWADRALRLTPAPGASGSAAVDTPLLDTESTVIALQARGSARILAGDADGCEDVRRAITLAAGAGLDGELGRAYANLVSATGEARLYGLSGNAVREALDYFQSHDLDAFAGYTRVWHARCLFEQGQWAQAEAELDSLAADETQRSQISTLTGATVLGRLRARRGTGDCWSSLDEALAVANRTGSLQRLAPVLAARAEAQWLAGDTPTPTDLLSCFALAVERGHPWFVGELGLWLHRFGRLHALPDVAAMPYRLQVHGDPVAAGQAWLAAGCPYEAADAWCDADNVQAVTGALAIFTRLGAEPGRARATRQLRTLGVRTIPRGPRRATAADPDGLTPRQREVSALVAAGLTDAQIAARLHLSVKTVGHHVSAVLAKTQSTTRRDLYKPRDV